jgi:hypothetical protein
LFAVDVVWMDCDGLAGDIEEAYKEEEPRVLHALREGNTHQGTVLPCYPLAQVLLAHFCLLACLPACLVVML